MTDSEKRAKEILEEYANYYSQVDLEQLTAKLDQLKSKAIKEFANNIKSHFFQMELVEYINSFVEEVETGLR